jgi:hypothetical protein
MDTLSAFAMGEASRGRALKVFDWDRAAQLIKEHNAQSASAGLSGDWEWTGGLILRDGKPVDAEDTYTYLASTWATPELHLDGESYDCWLHTDKWDSSTYWPESALKILAGE